MHLSQWPDSSVNSLVDRQTGSAIVVVLLLMLALTTLGIMSIHSGLLQLQLVQNSQEGKKHFYLAESAALEGIQRVVDAAAIDRAEKIHFWYHTQSHLRQTGIDFRYADAWITDGSADDNALESRMHADLHIAAVEWRLATGSSAIVTGSRLYMNRIYGLCNRRDHPFIVEVGYYIRY